MIRRRREKQRGWETCYRTRKGRILRNNTHDLLIVDESKESLCGRETDRDLRAPVVDASRVFCFCFLRTSSVGGGGVGGWGCVARLFSFLFLKKNQSTPRPSEHPPVMGGKMSKRLGGIKGCKYKTSSWHSSRFPDADKIGPTV